MSGLHTLRAGFPGRLLTAAALAGASLLMGGCGLRLDMHDQPKIRTLRENDFFSDGRGARPVIEGTVARGELREDSAFYTGKVNGQYVTEFPFPVTAEVLERGRDRFNIYCSPCHSRMGDGNGMIVQRGFKRPPSYHIDRLREKPVGYVFDVQTNGLGSMAEYASQVSAHDRWAIAAYVRALQLSQHATRADVPACMTVSNTVPDLTVAVEPPVSNLKGTHGGAEGQGGGNPTK